MLAQVLAVVLKAFAGALFSPLFFLLIVLIGWQYKRVGQDTTDGSNPQNRDYLQSALISTMAGAAGGLIGSFLLILFGIDLGGLSIVPLFIVALLLMLIHPRFICFAYAGGILSICNILFGVPHLQVAHMMGLVAILHMVESLLILITGHLNPIPVYTRRPGFGMIGGFNLQKFWPIPLVAAMSSGFVSGPLAAQNWWPLINSDPGLYHGISITLVPVLAILGYGEVSTTSVPAERTRASALYLAVFSFLLLGLSVLGSHYPELLILPALFGPLGHELIIYIGLRSESGKIPIFLKPSRGVMVLDVVKGSPSFESGLLSRDVIAAVNGSEVNSSLEFAEQLAHSWGRLTLTVLRNGDRIDLSMLTNKQKNLGIILVPDMFSRIGTGINPGGAFLGLLLKLRRLFMISS